MNKNKPFVITFAGPPGTSKTPIAFHLSYSFNLPIIQMDAIRMEVREDLLISDKDNSRVKKEFEKRSVERYQNLLKQKISFIDDSSADRFWKQTPDAQYYQLKKYGYSFFIISMDLSKKFIKKLYKANLSAEKYNLDRNFIDHIKFVNLYKNDVDININDDNFSNRMEICKNAVQKFILSMTS